MKTLLPNQDMTIEIQNLKLTFDERMAFLSSSSSDRMLRTIGAYPIKT
jgi:hypothetical protein